MSDKITIKEKINLITKKLPILFQKLYYEVKNIELIIEALTHPSCKQEMSNINHYERLEFLGDAVLKMVSAEKIFLDNPRFTEAEISRAVGNLVSRDYCAKIAEKINLNEFIIVSYGESKINQFNRHNLSNCIEAIIAVLYLDGGYEVVKNFIIKLWNFDDLKDQDYKTQLQEFCQKKYHTIPKYIVLEQTGPKHNTYFSIKIEINDKIQSSIGFGSSKKDAEKDAAKKMIDILTIIK
jgi:ribonuclease-3